MGTKTFDIKKHKSYLDVIRILAILLVYFAHTGNNGAHHYTIEGGIISYFTSMTLYSIGLAGPYFFFVISGGLLLGREVDLKNLITKRIPKYLIIILVFNLFQLYYGAILHYPENLVNPFVDLLRMIYGYVLITQYWFLNAYLVFLCLLPMLSAAAKRMSKKDFEYLFGLFFVIQFVLKILEYFMQTEHIVLDFGPWDSLFIAPFAGYYIENHFSEFLSDKKKMLLLNLAMVLAVIANVWYINLYYTNQDSIGPYLNGTEVLFAFTIYADIKLFFMNKTLKENTAKVLKVLGDGVFLAYLIEIQMKELYLPVYEKTVNVITWLGACTLWIVLGVVTALLIRFVLSLIPGVKKIIP